MTKQEWLKQPAYSLPGLSARTRHVLNRNDESDFPVVVPYTVGDLFYDLCLATYWDYAQWRGLDFPGFGIKAFREVKKSALELGFKASETEGGFLAWSPKSSR